MAYINISNNKVNIDVIIIDAHSVLSVFVVRTIFPSRARG